MQSEDRRLLSERFDPHSKLGVLILYLPFLRIQTDTRNDLLRPRTHPTQLSSRGLEPSLHESERSSAISGPVPDKFARISHCHSREFITAWIHLQCSVQL